MQVAHELRSIVQPAWAELTAVRVVERDAALDEPLRAAAARMRTMSEAADITAAVRVMYSRAGLDPTKTRPSSEALLRRVRKGDELPRVNSLVDVINWCSLETQLPFGLYDANRIVGGITLRFGLPGEQYAGIRKNDVHVAGRMALVDDSGAFGNPTSDSARTMITPETTRAFVVIFAPAALPASVAERALATTLRRVAEFCGAR
jgi:DNA/RNA-binding domain of Phe-tRNA-synthetase-like protein